MHHIPNMHLLSKKMAAFYDEVSEKRKNTKLRLQPKCFRQN